jgi:hypothetical protein
MTLFGSGASFHHAPLPNFEFGKKVPSKDAARLCSNGAEIHSDHNHSFPQVRLLRYPVEIQTAPLRERCRLLRFPTEHEIIPTFLVSIWENADGEKALHDTWPPG